MTAFAFYGRVSTEDQQDPESSKGWQLSRARALIEPHGGQIVAEYFDIGQSRSLPWKRRPQASQLLHAIADPARAFDAIVVGSGISGGWAAKELCEKGMKVLAYSVKENALNRRGWYRDGENINYFQNSMQETTDTGRIKTYFTLSFDFTFKHDDDTVFFAYNYPYTYT